jgi:hypothetical protein
MRNLDKRETERYNQDVKMIHNKEVKNGHIKASGFYADREA